MGEVATADMGSRKRPTRSDTAPSQKHRPPKAVRSRLRRPASLLAAALVVAALALGLVLSAPLFRGGSSGPRTAAIVDQLSLTAPNPSFVASATAVLEEAGYAVDYYPGEEVTVELYRDLPTQGYGLIVLRVHASRLLGSDRTAITDDVTLFTSDPYSLTTYDEERRTKRLSTAHYDEGGTLYFGIAPGFIRSSMRGEFEGTTVILMGCDGLRSDATAEAFVGRGADAFVGWSGPVSSAHTDATTESLLRNLLTDGLSTREAVAQTTAEVGPDPEYGSTLLVHPPEG